MNAELDKIREEMQVMKKEYLDKMQSFFHEQVKTLFTENPKLNSFSVSVSNHEFNDGDATYFSVNSEVPEINGFSYGYLGEEDILKKAGITAAEVEDLSTKVNDLFETFDGDDLEVMYGDEYGELTFERESS